ncbi:hypothetical protein HOP50_07g49280 [Chloropicon primus]|uniref:Uncharacterized protein n=1 Tax=Chloropicon primus TaxID=1764295 RepID=A0A5B8MPF4_9CHLO|nr:hypothetical protein A3770_07p49070 [Chloropicon primus]UPR01606.1 hypothetical protein HOP50_07g49280 [Chloropicon primus]|eukprot:QDZ22389.1 hypothetical protein A3770_07p49070 [Chloropicon primus]
MRDLATRLAARLGVELAYGGEYNGPRVKSYSPEVLGNWSIVAPARTPLLKGTVFSRVGIHLQALFFCVYASGVFILSPMLLGDASAGWDAQPRGVPRNETFSQGEYLSANYFVNQVVSVFGVLFSLLVSRYVFMVVQTHWIQARSRRGDAMRNTQLVINLVASAYDPDDQSLDKHAKQFGLSVRSLLLLGPTMTIRYLEGKRGEDLGRILVTEDCVATWTTWAALQPLHKHTRVTRVYREIMALVKTEFSRPGGALSGMLPEVYTELLLALNRCQAACCSMISSTNGQKLPFSYVQLIQWSARIVFLIYLFDLAIDIAEYAMHYRCALPFVCLYGSGCSTGIYLGLLACVSVLSYIVIGLLDLHGALRNLYQSDCGNVQRGFLHGIQVSSAILVKGEALPM